MEWRKEIPGLKIKTQDDLEGFHNAWLLDFLDNAQPDEHCLVELLQAKHYITDHNIECMKGSECRNRRDLARKLWFHMKRIKVEDFMRDIAPTLCQYYHHLIPEGYRKVGSVTSSPLAGLSSRPHTVPDYTEYSFDTDVQQQKTPSLFSVCLHHRLRQPDLVKPVADVLYSHSGINLDQYETHTSETSNPELVWQLLFNACMKVPAELRGQFEVNLRKLLPKSDQSTFTFSFSELLETGLPCTCGSVLKTQGSSSMDKTVSSKITTVDEVERFRTWATENGLSSALVETLHRHKFQTMGDIHMLKETNTACNFKQESGLRVKDYAVLLKALEKLTVSAAPKSILDFLVSGERVRILMLGKTGSGKSSTGNRILGERAFPTSANFQSESKTCRLEQREREDKTTIEIMDSPGLFDPLATHEEIAEVIVQAVAGLHPGPDAILCTIRAGRYTEEDFETFQRLKEMFDDTITGHMIIVFTHVDQIHDENISPENFVETMSTPALKQVLQQCGNRFVCIDNSKFAQPEAVDQQLHKLTEEIREVRDANKGMCYVCTRYEDIGTEVEIELQQRLNLRRSQSVITCDSGIGDNSMDPYTDDSSDEVSACFELIDNSTIQMQTCPKSDSITETQTVYIDTVGQRKTRQQMKVLTVDRDLLKRYSSSSEEANVFSETKGKHCLPEDDKKSNRNKARIYSSVKQQVPECSRPSKVALGTNLNNLDIADSSDKPSACTQPVKDPNVQIQGCHKTGLLAGTKDVKVTTDEWKENLQQKKVVKVDHHLLKNGSSSEEEQSRHYPTDYGAGCRTGLLDHNIPDASDGAGISAQLEKGPIIHMRKCPQTDHLPLNVNAEKDGKKEQTREKKVVKVDPHLLSSSSSEEESCVNNGQVSQTVSSLPRDAIKNERKHVSKRDKLSAKSRRKDNSDGESNKHKHNRNYRCRKRRPKPDTYNREECLREIRTEVTRNKASHFFIRLLRRVRTKIRK